MPGDDRPDAVHFAAWAKDGTVISACLVAPQPCPWLPELAPAWVLRQMATQPEWRGTGAGAAVLAAVIEDLSPGALWCHAREAAVAFYLRHGFTPHGQLFIDEELGIPHLRLWRRI